MQERRAARCIAIASIRLPPGLGVLSRSPPLFLLPPLLLPPVFGSLKLALGASALGQPRCEEGTHRLLLVAIDLCLLMPPLLDVDRARSFPPFPLTLLLFPRQLLICKLLTPPVLFPLESFLSSR